MSGIKIGGNRLISLLLSIVMCLTVLTGTIWALTGLFKVGMSIEVSYDPLVKAKVYLSTDSNGAKDSGLKQLKADYSEITANNFVKENSALVLNTHDNKNDDSGAKSKSTFEGSSLTCNNNGEMQFYVLVENYNITNNIYYHANVIFADDNGMSPFIISNNPKFVISDPAGGGVLFQFTSL